jgi:glycosyl transferase, family 25
MGAYQVASSNGTVVSDRLAIPVLYINRDRDVSRRDFITQQLQKAGIEAHRIPAVEGTDLPPNLRAYFDVNGSNLSLKPGEIGCYASHLKAANEIIARDLPFALVLEDDACLAPDTLEKLEELVKSLTGPWDLVHLSGKPRQAVKPVTETRLGTTIVRYSRVPSGTVGYLMSRRGAQKFLRPCKRKWPVDTDIRRPWVFGMDIYGVLPQLVGHNDDLTSAIQTLGGRARRRRGLPSPRNGWSINPLHGPQATFYNLRMLGPLWWATCLLKNLSRQSYAPMVGLALAAPWHQLLGLALR